MYIFIFFADNEIDMASLNAVVSYLDSLLQTQAYSGDSSQNGLQVEALHQEIRKIAFAVDSGLSIIEEAVRLEADLLIVHHGLFWKTPITITGILSKKIDLLLGADCSLYCSHLPLDGHLEVGNAAELARLFELEEITQFCEYDRMYCGAKGLFKKPRTLEYFQKKCSLFTNKSPLVLPFGKNEISRVGIVTGSGAFALDTCVKERLDCLISGEPKQAAYHHAKELHMNALFAGHYATETFGVKALAKRLMKDFDITTHFIDEDTGI